MIKPRVLIGGSREFVETGRSAAGNELNLIGEVFSPEDVVVQIDSLRPDGLLIPVEWAKVGMDIAYLRSNIKVFVAGNVNMETYSKLMTGRVLTVPEEPYKAVKIVAAVLGKLSPTRFQQEEESSSLKISIAGEVEVVDRFITAVYAPKGGVGKTTVATNAAAMTGMWAQKIEKEKGKVLRTALLDFNMDYGSGEIVMGYSDVKNVKSVISWQDITLSSPWEDIRECLNYHAKSNVYYLAPPLTAGERSLFTAELSEKIFLLIKKYFHFVFVDLGVALEKRDPAVMTLDKATNVLLVTKMDYETVNLLVKFVKYEAKPLVGDISKVSLVINDMHKTWFGVRDILNLFEENIGFALPPRAQIPREKMIEDYGGKGAPLVCFKPDLPFSQSIMSLCQSLIGTRVNLTKRNRNILNLFKRKGLVKKDVAL